MKLPASTTPTKYLSCLMSTMNKSNQGMIPSPFLSISTRDGRQDKPSAPDLIEAWPVIAEKPVSHGSPAPLPDQIILPLECTVLTCSRPIWRFVRPGLPATVRLVAFSGRSRH